MVYIHVMINGPHCYNSLNAMNISGAPVSNSFSMATISSGSSCLTSSQSRNNDAEGGPILVVPRSLKNPEQIHEDETK